MIRSSLSDGVSLGPGRCLIVIQRDDTDASDVEFSSLVLTVDEGKVKSVIRPPFVVSRIVDCSGDQFLLGRLGQVVRLRAGAFAEEQIVGVEHYGFLVDACTIGEYIYAVGMRRQAYVRETDNKWSRSDSGVLDDSKDVENVTGFRSIDGFSRDDIYAVGLEGEIWHFKSGSWRKNSSPTNVILEQVRAAPTRNVYIVGQAGLLLRGSAEAWSVVDHSATEDDFWGLEWFSEHLYLATASQLFRLAGGEMPLQLVDLPEGSSFARLRVGHGALWSFGPNEVRWTADGESWHQVEIPGG